MTGCTPREVLCALLDEQLCEAERQEVERHVETCLCCQRRLEELTGHCVVPWLEPGPLIYRHVAMSRSAESQHNLTPTQDMPSTIHLDELSVQPSSFEIATGDGTDRLPQIADYDLIEMLGQGGMGVVYKARQRRLNRLVALKMIRPGGAGRAENLARLRIEAETVAKLRHPNIVQVYDVGEVEGLPFVCLELLEGGSLAERIAATPQDPQLAAETVATLAAAVQVAHKAGIVHRDLKPTNVLFTTDGTPKITDFGLAKRIEQEDGHTQTGQVMGSPSYMAPEQARGKSQDIGTAADIYTLGAILYQMLTGRPPFKGTTPVETVLQVLHEEPLAPSQLQSRVPRDLETICLKCLQKDPRRRYQSAEDLAADLRRFTQGEPIVARPIPFWERVWKWSRRRPGTASAASLAVVAALSLILGMFFHLQAERRLHNQSLYGEQTLLRAQAASQNHEWEKASWLLTNLQSSLATEPRLAKLQRRARLLLVQTQQQAADASRERREQQRFDTFCQHRDRAFERDAEFAAYDQPANLRATRQAVTDALSVYGIQTPADGEPHQVETFRWQLAQLPDELTASQRQAVHDGFYELLLVLAEAVAQPLDGEDALTQAEQGLSILDQAAELRPPTRALHQRRADCLVRAGRLEEAKRAWLEAEKLQPQGAFEHFLCGQQLYKRRRFAAASQHFEAVVQIQPEHFWAKCLLGICFLQEQRPAEAEVVFTSCLQQQPGYWPLFLFRGTAYGEKGRIQLESARAKSHASGQIPAAVEATFDLAEAEFQRALEINLSADDRYRVLCSRGLVRLRCGRLAEAEADLNDAISLCPSCYSPYRTLAQVYRQQGNFDRAEETLTQAIGVAPNVADLYRTRAQYAIERRSLTAAQTERALADLQKALSLDPAGPRAAEDHTRQGLLLTRVQQFDEALAACDKALELSPSHAEAHRLRLALLVELKEYDEVLRSTNAALAAGTQSADMYEIRGLARASAPRRDFLGAIEDYTHALRLRPDSARLRSLRGWAFLLADAPQLALGDFESALAMNPHLADGLNGRGCALAQLGRHQEAAADAESALQYGDGGSRTLYNTARIFALAIAAGEPQTLTDSLRLHYETRAQQILQRIVSQLPSDQRKSFWRDVVARDEALSQLRQRSWFAELASQCENPAPATAAANP